MVSDAALAELEPFTAGGGDDPGSAAARAGRPAPAGRLLFDGRGRVGRRETEVRCRQADGGYVLEVGGGGRFAISADGRSIELLPGGEADDPELTRHAVVGPCLCLALALRDCFCLHAAAVARDGRAVALVGPSGTGKSTLAGWLGTGGRERGWRRLADDVLPVRRTPGGPAAAACFPQLGLAAADQWGSGRPPALPLAAVYRLRPVAAEARPAVGAPRPREAVLALVRHTVAARLFAPELLERHLDFCRALAAELPVRELSCPRDRGQLGALEELLIGDLAGSG